MKSLFLALTLLASSSTFAWPGGGGGKMGDKQWAGKADVVGYAQGSFTVQFSGSMGQLPVCAGHPNEALLRDTLASAQTLPSKANIQVIGPTINTGCIKDATLVDPSAD